jgi:hypothetical protein
LFEQYLYPEVKSGEQIWLLKQACNANQGLELGKYRSLKVIP